MKGVSMIRHRPKQQSELFWARVVMRKWLNISTKDSDYSADSDDEEESDEEELDESSKESRPRNGIRAESTQINPTDTITVLRRRKSETFRAQYINTKDIKVCVGTWNVAGKLPPDDLVIDDWLGTNDPADIYVLGLQEMVPLNPVNIFGVEDNRPVPKWEKIIRESLNRIQPPKAKVKCYSDPSSPSRFKPSEDIPDIEEEILMLDSDSDMDEEIHPIDEETELLCEYTKPPEIDAELERQISYPKKFNQLSCLKIEEIPENKQFSGSNGRKLTRMISSTDRIGLTWPEPQFNLVSQHILERPKSFKSVKSFKSSRSFRTYNSFKSTANEGISDLAALADVDLETLLRRKRRPQYVRIISKQMVGIFITIWVRKGLRRHIHNVKVSTVGVGAMGYIGNKGSISVSMSVYQTLFCFICTHLTSGEKEGDEQKRNFDVHEIYKRTHFRSVPGMALASSIHDHEKLVWFGDLNYRLNMSYEKVRDLISRKEWSKLLEKDQLIKELKKGRTFDGWSEGVLTFPPTYKYECNSDQYLKDDSKTGRRTPAWCDRILSYGKGMKQLKYRRVDLRFSDHRPVTAMYMAEVEVLCPRKLQKALTFTTAEIENEDFTTNVGIKASLDNFAELERRHMMTG